MQTILETIHGSYLYDLAHANSDIDTYRVVLSDDDRYARQRKRGDDDQMVLSLDRFTEQVASGVPQALEALWSPEARISEEWRPFFAALKPSIPETQMRYRRTIRNFAFNRGGRTGTAAVEIDARKLRRHALRLALNLAEFMDYGRFNPQLSPEHAELVKQAADLPSYDLMIEAALDTAMWGGADTEPVAA